jgi:hypothetical protein
MSSKHFNLRITIAEANYLLSLMEDCKFHGTHWGNQEHFYKRQDNLIEKVEKIFKEAIAIKGVKK